MLVVIIIIIKLTKYCLKSYMMYSWYQSSWDILSEVLLQETQFFLANLNCKIAKHTKYNSFPLFSQKHEHVSFMIYFLKTVELHVRYQIAILYP